MRKLVILIVWLALASAALAQVRGGSRGGFGGSFGGRSYSGRGNFGRGFSGRSYSGIRGYGGFGGVRYGGYRPYYRSPYRRDFGWGFGVGLFSPWNYWPDYDPYAYDPYYYAPYSSAPFGYYVAPRVVISPYLGDGRWHRFGERFAR